MGEIKNSVPFRRSCVKRPDFLRSLEIHQDVDVSLRLRPLDILQTIIGVKTYIALSLGYMGIYKCCKHRQRFISKVSHACFPLMDMIIFISVCLKQKPLILLTTA